MKYKNLFLSIAILFYLGTVMAEAVYADGKPASIKDLQTGANISTPISLQSFTKAVSSDMGRTIISRQSCGDVLRKFNDGTKDFSISHKRIQAARFILSDPDMPGRTSTIEVFVGAAPSEALNVKNPVTGYKLKRATVFIPSIIVLVDSMPNVLFINTVGWSKKIETRPSVKEIHFTRTKVPALDGKLASGMQVFSTGNGGAGWYDAPAINVVPGKAGSSIGYAPGDTITEEDHFKLYIACSPHKQGEAEYLVATISFDVRLYYIRGKENPFEHAKGQLEFKKIRLNLPLKKDDSKTFKKAEGNGAFNKNTGIREEKQL